MTDLSIPLGALARSGQQTELAENPDDPGVYYPQVVKVSHTPGGRHEADPSLSRLAAMGEWNHYLVAPGVTGPAVAIDGPALVYRIVPIADTLGTIIIYDGATWVWSFAAATPVGAGFDFGGTVFSTDLTIDFANAGDGVLVLARGL